MDSSVLRKGFLKKLTALFVILSLLLVSETVGFSISESAFAANTKTNTYKNNYNVVTTKKLALRKGAGTSYVSVKTIKNNTTVYITKNSSGNWVKVKDSTGSAGYLPTRYLTKGTGSKITAKCKTKDSVNLRSGAGTNYNVLTVVPQNTTLSVTSNKNTNWGKVKYIGKAGYISSQYASYIYTIPSASSQTPVAAQPVSSINAYVTVGDYYQRKSDLSGTVNYSSSNVKVASVDAYGVVKGISVGKAVITAKSGSKSESYNVNVSASNGYANISNKTYTDYCGKTIYLTSSSGTTWTSSDTSVAEVSGGLVLCKKKGEAVISVTSYNGESATCLVTVKGKEAVRFTYANPNSASLNTKVTFVAITDTLRTDVKFVLTQGDNTYNIKASSKKKSGNTYVWKGTKKLTKAGQYNIVAYSMYDEKWSKSTGSYGKVFVTNTENYSDVSFEKKHASSKIVNFIAECEGFLSEAIYDPLLSAPFLTVGHGRVIFAGESFYNKMTKDEAYAYLVESIENDGYVKKLNSFLTDNNIKCNQYQFDSLLSFLYNLGMYRFDIDSELSGVLLNSYTAKDKTTRNLNNVVKQDYVNKFFAYHHADGACIDGLLYRRIDEAEIFFSGDYVHDGASNKSGFVYSCPRNAYFGCRKK